MSASFVNARRALWSAAPLGTVDLSTATNLGPLAPGTSMGEIDIRTADAFGHEVAVGAGQKPQVAVYASALIAALVTASEAVAVKGYVYIVNGSGTRIDCFHANAVAAYLMPVADEEARARCVYRFSADSDKPADFHTVVTGVVIFPA